MSDLDHIESLSDELFGLTKSHKATPVPNRKLENGRADTVPKWRRQLRAIESIKSRNRNAEHP